MKRTLVLFTVLLALVGYCVETFGQKLDVTQALCALNEKAPAVLDRFMIPLGAQHPREIVWQQSAPEGFGAVLALMQVVSVAPCPMVDTQEATLSIRALRLIERNPSSGTDQVVSEITDFSKSNPFRFDGRLYPRVPHWYWGDSIAPIAGMLITNDGALLIDVTKAPKMIFHGWTDPKVPTKPGREYRVEMEVKLTGLARLQIGIDYWRNVDSAYNEFDETCQKSNNCQGSLSNWFAPTDDWRTIRVPEVLR